MDPKENLAAVPQEATDLLAAHVEATMELRWLAENSGECLADHTKRLARINRILAACGLPVRDQGQASNG